MVLTEQVRYKYPRTAHLPWSPGLKNDDTLMDRWHLDSWSGKRVVVTEKMDGENTTLYPDYIHARSIDSRDHLSRSKVKAIHGRAKYYIPNGYRICGENVAAVHSIKYNDLPSAFMGFSVWKDDVCMDWDTTLVCLSSAGLVSVPVLFDGPFEKFITITDLQEYKQDPSNMEGFVVRLAEGFTVDQFSRSIAKWVRANHVQTDQHWMQKPVEWNGVKHT